MKILVIVPSYKPAYYYGGPIRSIAALCESLVRAGHQVEVFTTLANGTEELSFTPGEKQLVEGVLVTYFKRWTKDHSHFSPSLLWRVFKEAKHFDTIHIQSWWNLVAVPSTMICLMRGIKPVISPRGSLTGFTLKHGLSRLKRIIHTWPGQQLLIASMLHLTSDREKEEAMIYSPKSRKYVIPNLLENVIDISETRDDKIFQVLFLGRIDPAKNLEVILNAFAEPMTYPARLVIVGAGKPEYVDSLKTESDKERGIEWRGQIDGQEKQRLIASSDVLVLPSHTENYGNVVIEALQLGTPVLLSENVGLKDFVSAHNLGRIVRGGAEAWRSALNQMQKDESLRKEIRQKAPAVIKDNLGEKKLVKRYVEMYMEGKNVHP